MCCDKPLIVAVWISGKYVNQCQNCKAIVG